MSIFSQHLAEVGESYWQHARFALHISKQCCIIAFQAAIHALIPCCWTHSASRRLQGLVDELKARNSR